MEHKGIWQSPKTEAGRLLAAQIWDRLAAAYGQRISPSLRDAFLAELNAGEVGADTHVGPLAEDVAEATGVNSIGK